VAVEVRGHQNISGKILLSGGANYFSKVVFVFKVVFIFEVVFILEVVFIFEVILRRELFDRNMQNSD